jgi:hypothetical protein
MDDMHVGQTVGGEEFLGVGGCAGCAYDGVGWVGGDLLNEFILRFSLSDS